MNKILLHLSFVGVLTLITHEVHAQTVVNSHELKSVAMLEKAPAPVANNMADYRDIPIKAVRSFKNTWPAIDDESWYATPDGHRARFTEDGVLHLVTYNKNGKWMHTMRQYDETKLNKDVRAQVRSFYYDYNIILVDEIEMAMKPLTYVIHLEDKVSFKNVRIINREMEELTEIKKL